MGQARSARAAATQHGGGPGPTTTATKPAWLSDDAAAVWDRLSPVVPGGRLTPATAEAFGLCCTAVAEYAEADSIVAETGMLIANGQNLEPNPALAIRDRTDATVARWLKTFGLTPDAEPARPSGRAGRPHLVE